MLIFSLFLVTCTKKTITVLCRTQLFEFVMQETVAVDCKLFLFLFNVAHSRVNNRKVAVNYVVNNAVS